MRSLRNNYTFHTWHLHFHNNRNRYNCARKHYRLRMQRFCKECCNRGRKSRA
jgi:hypothetical protein